MALKSNFEASNDVSSPFVDEVANPGNGPSAGELQAVREGRAELTPRGAAALARRTQKKAPAPTTDTRGTLQKKADKASAFQEALKAAQGKK